MTVVPLEIIPDDEDSRFALACVDFCVDGRSVRALLDSGASRSAVVDWPGLASIETHPGGAGVFGGSTDRRRAQVQASFAGHEIGYLEVSVVSDDDPGHGNLVGQDILARFRCEYRLGDGVLILNGDLFKGAQQIHLDAGSHIYADVIWPTGEVASAVLDTGAAVTIVDEQFAAQHPGLFTHEGTSEGTDSSGAVRCAPVVRMASIQLLGATLDASPAAIVDLSGANTTVDRHMDLILGWPILAQGALIVDHGLRLASFHTTDTAVN